MAKDHELDWLLTQLEAIPHIKRLRIHSRLPIVIPARITDALVGAPGAVHRLQVLLVNHINHANEIDADFRARDGALMPKGRRDAAQPERITARRERQRPRAGRISAMRLFDAGVMPYYLHVLDRVQGAAHFMVSR